MTHRTLDAIGKFAAAFFTSYILTLKLLEDSMPIIKRYGLRAFRRKHKRKKRRKETTV